MKSSRLEVGSIVSFVVIGAIVALVLFAAVWGVRQRGEQVRRDEQIASQEESDGVTSDNDEDAADRQEDDVDPDARDDAATQEDENTVAVGGTDAATGGPGELPAAGLSSGLMSLVIIAAMTFMTTAYIRSSTERKTAFDL